LVKTNIAPAEQTASVTFSSIELAKIDQEIAAALKRKEILELEATNHANAIARRAHGPERDRVGSRRGRALHGHRLPARQRRPRAPTRRRRSPPFAGTGAVSSWRLRIPRAPNRRLDLSRLEGVRVALRYDAKDSGPEFTRGSVGRS